MKLYCKILILLFANILANNLLAWTYVGHEIISEIAYNNLAIDKQKKLDAILDTLIASLPNDAKKAYKSQPYKLCKLAKLSILPDYWKRMKFSEISNKLNINDNNLLLNLDNKSTATWHYSDKPVKSITPITPNLHRKKYNNHKGKLEVVLPQLINNVKESDQKRAKALGIIYITHLLEDAHQPLHAASRNDSGGNGFCLIQKNNKNQCSYNLHQYWDSAGKLIDSNNKKKIFNFINIFSASYKSSPYKDNAKSNLLVKNWLNESYEYWPTVYNTPENKYPTSQYQEQTRKIANDRIVLAAYRLKNLLESFLS